MAAEPKISRALKSAKTKLDNSLEAKDEKTGNPLEDAVWSAAAEVEYALFLFSISVKEDTKRSKWRTDPKLKKAEVKPILAETKGLLEKAEKHMENEDLINAYKNASIARDYLLRIQKRFTKEKREALKQKKTTEK